MPTRFPLVPSLLLAGALLVAASASTAAAQPFAHPSAGPVIDPANDGEVETVQRWYGYQVLLADVITWTLASRAETTTIPLFFSGSAVHLANREYGRAVGSAGLRFGGALIGALVGAAALPSPDCTEPDWWCLPIGTYLGALVGLVTAQLVDAFALSYKKVERPKRWVAPTATVTRGGGMVGLGGAF